MQRILLTIKLRRKQTITVNQMEGTGEDLGSAPGPSSINRLTLPISPAISLENLVATSLSVNIDNKSPDSKEHPCLESKQITLKFCVFGHIKPAENLKPDTRIIYQYQSWKEHIMIH